MSKVQNPIIGQASGKFANAIFQTQYGKNILRSCPLTVSNPKTPEQLAQREKFSMVTKFMSRILAILKVGFLGYREDMSSYSYALMKNLNEAVTGVYPVFTLDPTLLEISQGSLESLFGVVWDRPDAAHLQIDWTNLTADPPSAASDQLNVLIMDETQKIKDVYLNVATRSAGTVSITHGLPIGGSVNMYAFAFFSTADTVGKSGNELAGSVKRSGALVV